MKNILLWMVFVLSASVVFSEERSLPLADPFVLEHNGMYYAYGTHYRTGIVVYRSNDLMHWEGPCGLAPYGLALHKNDSWGEKNFWAPEIYKTDSGFVMTYSVEEHTAIAYADDPRGPFRQIEPYSVYFPYFKNIDSHIFVDDDGQAYLYWVAWFNDRGNEIFVSRLSPDLTHTIGAPVECLHSQLGTWEVKRFPDGHVSRVVEGPYVLKHKGVYYLTYSANDYRSQDYAVGYATSDSPFGPWKRYEGNPILRRPGNLVGTGHHAFFSTSEGDDYIVFHAHRSKKSVSPRSMYIAPYMFKERKNRPDRLVIDTKNIMIPVETGRRRTLQ